MINNFSSAEWSVITIVSFIELILKGFALWRAAKANHTYWFVGILVLNTFGILPIIYLLFFAKEPLLRKNKKK